MSNQPITSDSSGDDGSFYMPDYVHILLLHPSEDATKRALMIHNTSTDTWDLPYLIYPDSLRYDADRCARDLEHILSIPTEPNRPVFTVVAELLGSYGGAGLDGNDQVGFSRLMLVEPHITLGHMLLHKDTGWKDAAFVSKILQSLDKMRGNHGALTVALDYLKHPSDKVAEHLDPRYRFGWFDEAENWLKAELERQGHIPTARVVQEHVSSTSTLLRVECGSDSFYLKAPAMGCDEIPITAAMWSLFPRNAVEVMGTCEKLNSFIMRGFEHEEPGKELYGEMMMTLGKMQVQSLEHVDTLKEAGCEDRGPDVIAEKMREWMEDEDIRKIFGFEIESLEECVPKVLELCSKLSTYHIPLTVVHGDFDTRNSTVLREGECGDGGGKDERSRRIVFFDWQYTCISHPFFYLHEWEDRLSEDVLNGYLMLWTDYERIDQIREAFEIGKHLGWCLKMWTSIECFKKFNVQQKSSTAEFMFDAFTTLKSGISRMDVYKDVGDSESRPPG